MVAKKKKTSVAHRHTTKDDEERRPVVTQVVEVVEVIEEKGTTAQIPKADDKTPQASADQPKVPDKPSVEESQEEEHLTSKENEEKSKEVISELFQKNETVGVPEISVHKPSAFRSVLLWLVIVILVALVVSGGLLFWRGSLSLPTVVLSPSPTPTDTPAVTPTPALNRTDITIEVLNGAGAPGVAGTMKDFLEEKGYTVSNTSNADSYDYAETEIHVKPEKEAYLQLLVDDLKADYVLGTTDALLSTDSLYDAQVIVGKE